MTQFRLQLRERGALPPEVCDSQGLWRWSIDNPEEFWGAIWRDAKIVADGPGPNNAPWQRVFEGAMHMRPPRDHDGPQWFVGTKLNFAEHLLRRRDDHPALIAWNESGRTREMSYSQLAQRVARAASALRSAGVTAGDRVAGFLPNIPEAVVAMIASASIGAIWSSCSPDFGAKAAVDRFGQIEPVVLIAADGYTYAGKRIDCAPRVGEIASQLPSLRAVWIVDNSGSELSSEGASRFAHGARAWRQVMEEHDDNIPVFARVPFDSPLYILYSSGTTGLPKPIVHGAGGTLLQHWKELALHTDVRDTDVLFYFTTCGWMMWNWLVSGLALGASVVLFDGAPLVPDASILWRLAEAEEVTVFGTSAKYLAMCEKLELDPATQHVLPALRTILSTGSPLATTSYDYVYQHIKQDVALASISGGTDIVSCFALGDPSSPVYRGELSMRGLGMAVDVYDEQGNSLVEQAGELVCTRPFPSMPVSFWNDPTGDAYRAAYFSHFPGVWRHGDWAELTAHGGVIIHGRSDATLNPGGVRIGTAEIYRQVEQVPQVLESVVVEQTIETPQGPDTRIVLFVRMKDGEPLTEQVCEQVRRSVREGASPHHVPKVIAEVRDIPRTISGKITELAVRETIHGRQVRNTSAMANPESLDEYRDHPALRGSPSGVTLRV